MNSYRSLPFLSAVALAGVLSLGGCKSNNPPANQNAQQPAAGQPMDQGAGGSPSGMAPSAANGAPTTAPTTAPAPVRQAPPPPAVVQLPAGTDIRVRLDTDLGSNTSNAGDSFTATVADDVMHNGEVVIPKGARASGTVVDAKPLGKFKGGAALAIRLDRVRTKWGSYAVETSSISRAQQGKGKRSAGFIGGGAGLGALIGGLAGGGKGAAIGALAGGGAGTAGSAFTGNKQIVLPAESLLTFKLDHSVRITERRQGERDEDQDPQLQTR